MRCDAVAIAPVLIVPSVPRKAPGSVL